MLHSNSCIERLYLPRDEGGRRLINIKVIILIENINFVDLILPYSERLQHERQEALESMGISVQASGIKVEKNKYYLVNLNADPSLNELLVYYLKDCTLIGSSDKSDIQLSGS